MDYLSCFLYPLPAAGGTWSSVDKPRVSENTAVLKGLIKVVHFSFEFDTVAPAGLRSYRHVTGRLVILPGQGCQGGH